MEHMIYRYLFYQKNYNTDTLPEIFRHMYL